MGLSGWTGWTGRGAMASSRLPCPGVPSTTEAVPAALEKGSSPAARAKASTGAGAAASSASNISAPGSGSPSSPLPIGGIAGGSSGRRACAASSEDTVAPCKESPSASSPHSAIAAWSASCSAAIDWNRSAGAFARQRRISRSSGLGVCGAIAVGSGGCVVRWAIITCTCAVSRNGSLPVAIWNIITPSE